MKDSKDAARKGLGRGLDALLPSSRSAPPAPAAKPASEGSGAREVALELIDPNPYQTRMDVDDTAIEELANSIRATGVLQPVLLRPISNGRFQLMAGQRRWTASKRAGKQTIPAVVKQASDAQAMEITIVENLQREDLNPFEQAKAYERLSLEFGMTQEQMAQRTGKDRTSVANFLRILKLPAEIQDVVGKGYLSMGHAKALMTLLNEPQMLTSAFQLVGTQDLSVRGTEQLVHDMLYPNPDLRPPRKRVMKTDPNVAAAEHELQSALGCKVAITDRGGRGRIVIEYANLEDFDRILEMLGARR
jgi:ParB family chromosome partitioning protein